MPETTTIGFRFIGGIAEQGQLNFYEAGRFQYATARMLYAIEHYRNTGEVVDRIRRRINADFRVSAAQEGSFLQEVLLYATPVIGDFQYAQSILHIPFDKLFSFLLSKVIPKSSGSDRLADIAEKQIDALTQFVAFSQEREKTSQAQTIEETKRLQMVLNALRNDPTELRNNELESGEISNIVKKYSDTPARLLHADGSADFIATELQSEVYRNHTVSQAEDDLNRIDPESEQRMVDRMRKLFPEIGQPLQRSAEEFDIELNHGDMPIASLNGRRIQQISETTKDDKPIRIDGNIIKLDKESGFGRFRPYNSRTVLSFSIPREIFGSNKKRFIEAFTTQQVTVIALPHRDGIGNITRLVLLEVV